MGDFRLDGVDLAALHSRKARVLLKVLAVAKRHGHRGLVLGAWGCGAFGNDTNEIARLFREVLEEPFRGAFEHVLFAIS